MKLAGLLALATVVAACGKDAMISPDAPATITTVTSSPTADTTWTGTIRVQSSLAIPSGVTVTVAAGSTLQVASNASISVAGTLAIAGTKAQR